MSAPPIIQLFWCHLDIGDAALDALRATLSADERARESRYVLAHDARRFVARRGMLRTVLGDRVGCRPVDVELSTDRWGKPFLAGPALPLSFNLSSSGPVAVVALGDGRPLGVDVEVMGPQSGDVDVARSHFSPAEGAGLLAATPSDFGAAFLRVWTRKEAWVKAKGRGLSIPLDSFDVSLAPDDAQLLEVRGRPAERARWRLADVSGRYCGVEVMACLAASGSSWTARSAVWTSPESAPRFS